MIGIDRLIHIALTQREKLSIKVIDFFLWLVLITLTYYHFVSPIDLSAKTLIDDVLSGKFILYLAWAMCVCLFYFLLRFLLIVVLINSKIGLTLFIKIITPKEYRISFLNVYYKKVTRTNREYLEVANEYMKNDNINIEQVRTMLTSFVGIILKLSIILTVEAIYENGFHETILLIALMCLLGILVYLLSGMASVKGRQVIYNLLQTINPNT